MEAELPPPILISPEGSFAWDVFHRRHPVLVENVLAALPYGPEQIRDLRALLAESTGAGVMEPLRDGAPDAALWREWDRGYHGKPWADAPFLWAESFFFRRILEATGYYALGVDPYEPMKDGELSDTGLEAAFGWYGALAGLEPARRFAALVEASVLGNRADLVFQVTQAVEGYTAVNPPLADDTERIWERLCRGETGAVAFVCDNAGRELISDLLLAHELLTTHTARSVEMHVKPAPYYISDATAADVGKCLRRLRAIPGALGEAGRALFESAAAGRLRVLTHPFWCSPLTFHALPDDLRASLGGRFLIFKGDLNYRRLVGDNRWDPTTPFADTAAYLRMPLAALRAAKSDVIVGVSRSRVDALDAAEADWRLNGRHSLIQTAN